MLGVAPESTKNDDLLCFSFKNNNLEPCEKDIAVAALMRRLLHPAARIRIRLRIRQKVSDPTGSGSATPPNWKIDQSNLSPIFDCGKLIAISPTMAHKFNVDVCEYAVHTRTNVYPYTTVYMYGTNVHVRTIVNFASFCFRLNCEELCGAALLSRMLLSPSPRKNTCILRRCRRGMSTI